MIDTAIRSTLEVKIQKFILQYGADQLINWLDDFESIWHSMEYESFRSLEKEACKACGIPAAEMRKCSNNESINARRIISLMAEEKIGLTVPIIAKLLSLSTRSVYNYIKDAQNWIDQPRANKQFMEAYNQVLETFKIQQ